MATKKQLAFYVNLADCTGCKACQLACKDKNDLPLGVRWRRILEYSGGTWRQQGEQTVPVNVFTYYLSAACMHCERPPCAEVCPTGAITKREEDGVVLLDAEKCIGCRYCQWACPYGAVAFNQEKGLMTKCNFCVDLLAKGERPACVDACPFRAIDFGTLEELRARHGSLADPAPLPSASLTGPAVVFTPHRNTEPWNGATGEVTNVEEV
jgi:anaerobic dimethyl sulfoxide reductase subunit B (iron-sulfur subunit)